MNELQLLRQIRARRDIPAWLKSVGFRILAEIGVSSGGHLQSLLKANPEKLVAVDLWADDGVLQHNDSRHSSEQIDRHYQAVLRLAEKNPCVDVRKGDSADVARQFDDGSFDFVYIDADHTVDGVRSDIAAWWPKVRDGGVMGGHDYVLRRRPDGLAFGVVPAVHEFVGLHSLQDWFHCTWPDEQPGNWFIQKPQQPPTGKDVPGVQAQIAVASKGMGKTIDGFVTLAVGEAYLERAVAFALSSGRFGIPTTLMYRDVDPSSYRSLFAEVVDLSDWPTVNRQGSRSVWELKKYAYRCSEAFKRCAFVDADSLVIRDPRPMFDALAGEQVHTPCGRDVRDDERWAAGRITTRAAARAVGVPEHQPIPTVNGGFLFWQRGDVAQRWFAEYESLFHRLAAFFEKSSSGGYAIRDELCIAIAMALHAIPRFKSNSSIGIWDASGLILDIEHQEFECTKRYFWEGHRFQPYIAHFGGSKFSPLYRRCVEFLTHGTPWRLSVFDAPKATDQFLVPANGYSLSDRELQALTRFVQREGVRSVLEFGPGRSTECFLRSGCDVWSFEYQQRWLEYFRRVLGEHPRLRLGHFENNAEVRLPELAGRRFDLAFVDAPTQEHRPAGVPHSRLNTTMTAAEHADLIVLHNADRCGELATIDALCAQGWNWGPVAGEAKLVVLRRDRRVNGSATAKRIYDFSHWPALPKVSCQCITYGRTTLLDESVECFLRQDFPGVKELVILNDLPSLRLHFEHPDVRVINLPYRLRTIGEKRNACVASCTGEIIFVWDDDDISLPHRISYSLTRMTNHRYYKADRMWYWASGAIRGTPRKAVCHPMGCWSSEFFDAVSGYPHTQSGQDAGLEERFKGEHRHVEVTESRDVYYIYRFPGTGSYHLSTAGYGKGYDEAAQYVEQAGIQGDYEIRPGWRQDYVALVAAVTEEMTRRDRTPSTNGST